jgi:hypothetical protein
MRASCFTAPIVPSAVMGGIFCGFDVAQGRPTSALPRSFALYAGGLYIYNAIQCPMEALHGRSSLLHNFLAGGALGYAGVLSGAIGVPFLSPYYYAIHSRSGVAAIGAVVYGSLAAAFASFGGKTL